MSMTDSAAGKPKLTKYTADSTGVELWVQPISPFTFRAIRQKAIAIFPDPDEAPYQLPMPNAALPGDLMAAQDNPEYVKALAVQIQLRSNFIVDATITLACDPTPNKDQLVKRFEAQRQKLGKWMELPADAWEATLLHCILLGKNEFGHIRDLASEDLPLTPEEVEDGIARFFRPDVPGKIAGKLVRPAPSL